MDKEIEEFLKDVVGVIEATNFEKSCLWEYWHQERGYTWEQNNSGFMETVGYLAEMPVTIDMQTVKINGRKILFYYSPSMVTDARLVGKWLENNLPECARQKYNREYFNHTDAMNSHNVINGNR